TASTIFFILPPAKSVGQTLVCPAPDRLKSVPRSRLDDFLDLVNDPLDLFICVEEMRADADARSGAMINQNVARRQFSDYLARMRNVNDNRTAALRRIPRRIDAPALFVGQLDQTPGQANRFRADAFDADLVDDVITAFGRVERRNRRRAMQEAVNVAGVIDLARLERERRAVSHPAGDFRFEFVPQFGPYIT